MTFPSCLSSIWIYLKFGYIPPFSDIDGDWFARDCSSLSTTPKIPGGTPPKASAKGSLRASQLKVMRAARWVLVISRDSLDDFDIFSCPCSKPSLFSFTVFFCKPNALNLQLRIVWWIKTHVQYITSQFVSAFGVSHCSLVALFCLLNPNDNPTLFGLCPVIFLPECQLQTHSVNEKLDVMLYLK